MISTFLSKGRIIEKIDSLGETEGAEIDFQFHPSFAYLRDIDNDNNLENKYGDALEHKKQLEDKAKSLVALTTISATMMLGLGSTASSMFGGDCSAASQGDSRSRDDILGFLYGRGGYQLD